MEKVIEKEKHYSECDFKTVFLLIFQISCGVFSDRIRLNSFGRLMKF